MGKYNKTIAGLLTIVFLVMSVLCGCAKKSVSSDDRFTGSWRSKKGKTYKIMSFRVKGTWSLQIRKEGKLAKIVEKRGEAKGNWNVKDGFLYLYIVESEEDDDWKIDTTIVYEIVEMTLLNMSLKGPSGRVEKWSRVKSSKQSGEARQLATIRLDPVVVNLKKEKIGGKSKFLCIEVEFILNETQDPTMPAITIHPKVRETIIFYLSSLTYPEVNTMEDIDSLKGDLLVLLKPYISGYIEKLSIKNVVITSKWGNVETFLAEYKEEETPETEKKEKESD